MDKPLAYHTLFMPVEYDENYTGGNYSGVGQTVLVPVVCVELVGMAKTFEMVTGLSCRHIVHYSPDVFKTADGKDVGDWEDVFEHNKLSGK